MADFLVAQYVREHLRDAEQEPLARRARRHGRPLRARLAERLRALAARIDQAAHPESDIATA